MYRIKISQVIVEPARADIVIGKTQNCNKYLCVTRPNLAPQILRGPIKIIKSVVTEYLLYVHNILDAYVYMTPLSSHNSQPHA